jgi:hypothetical protein
VEDNSGPTPAGLLPFVAQVGRNVYSRRQCKTWSAAESTGRDEGQKGRCADTLPYVNYAADHTAAGNGFNGESMKISEMEGAALDRLIARAEGIEVKFSTTEQYWRVVSESGDLHWEPHRDWAQAGPIIERESISLIAPKIGSLWEAGCGNSVETQIACNGRTPLEAAMRVYATFRFGEEVPD